MPGLPPSLLRGVLWSCDDTRHPDRAAFGTALHQYQVDIRGDAGRWDPTARILPVPRVRISFTCWDDEEQVEATLALEASDGAGFDALELMHGVCDGIAAHLRVHGRELYDHHFFEGLSQVPSEGTAHYAVDFGS